jgi:hypothetical protein
MSFMVGTVTRWLALMIHDLSLVIEMFWGTLLVRLKCGTVRDLQLSAWRRI